MSDNVHNINDKVIDDRKEADPDFIVNQITELQKANEQLGERLKQTNLIDPGFLAVQIRLEMLIDALITKDSRISFEYQFQAHWHQAMQTLLSQAVQHELTKGITH